MPVPISPPTNYSREDNGYQIPTTTTKQTPTSAVISLTRILLKSHWSPLALIAFTKPMLTCRPLDRERWLEVANVLLSAGAVAPKIAKDDLIAPPGPDALFDTSTRQVIVLLRFVVPNLLCHFLP